MLERLVENWLTSVGELGYQTPFAQMLVAEGHRVLQGPVHHPFEHGKDIITVNKDGQLCAYQLKGPREINDLDGLERYQGQLDALALAAISHPSLGEPRLADRVFVVTNGELRPEVRDRLAQISAGNVIRRLPPLEYLERDHLVGRLLAAHGKYLPSDPGDFRRLVDLYSQSGDELLEVGKLSAFLKGILPREEVRPVEAIRALSSMTLFTAYSLRGAETLENHLAVAQGWLCCCMVILFFAEQVKLGDKHWSPTFDLAFQAVRRASRALLTEATQREDLIEPHLAEGAFYGTRALLVLGWSAAHLLSERHLGAQEEVWSPCKALLRREWPFVRVTGEAGTPYLFAIANARSLLESAQVGEAIVIGFTSGLLQRNHQDGVSPLPDPYHGIPDSLAYSLGLESDGIDPFEGFAGHAYGARAGIEWLARRLRRQAVSWLWPAYSRIATCEFVPSSPEWWLSQGDSMGVLEMRMPKAPQSWAELRRTALEVDSSIFPAALWDRAYMLPYLLLVLPTRFTSASCRAVDYFWFNTQDFSVKRSYKPVREGDKEKKPGGRPRGIKKKRSD